MRAHQLLMKNLYQAPYHSLPQDILVLNKQCQMGKSNESNNGSEFKEKTFGEKKIISRCKVQLGVTTTALTEILRN